LMIISIVVASYLLMTLVDSALTDNLLSDLDRRRAIANAVGVTSKNVAFSATLLSGILRLLVLFLAVLALGAPFGFYSADMVPALQRAYFGFQLGEMTISPSSILGGIALFTGIWAVTRLVRGWMSNTLLPRTSLDAGLQNSIATIVGYIGIILAISASLSEIGLSLQNIAYVASALAVGIGFGLQAIVNNFVSGLILLAERPIRVGDIIAAAGEEGYVRRISVRATEIETFDRATLIVPNSLLITSTVKNWVYGNTWSRLRIALSLGYDSDVDAVRTAMLGAAEDDPRILPSPAPRVFLANMSSTALEFELIVMVASMETLPAVKSDLLLRILKVFRAKGIRVVAQLPALPPPVVVSLDEALGAVAAAKLRGEERETPAPKTTAPTATAPTATASTATAPTKTAAPTTAPTSGSRI
jgi:potassium efflux system protein